MARVNLKDDIKETELGVEIPDSAVVALTGLMKEMYGQRFDGFGAYDSNSVKTCLTIEGKKGILRIEGLIKSMESEMRHGMDDNAFMSPYKFKSPFQQVVTTVKFNLLTTNTTFELKDDADSVLYEAPTIKKLKTALYDTLYDYLTASYEGGVLERLIDQAFDYVLNPDTQLKTPLATKPKQEEQIMFSKHVITAVKIGEINPITLELAVKKLAAGNSNIQLVEKKDVVYLVTEGADPIELNGDKFKELVEKALIGKTMAQVKSNVNLASLVQNLNVIEDITLTKPETNLADMLK